MGHYIDGHSAPRKGLGEPVSIGVIALASAGATALAERYGDAAAAQIEEWGGDFADWAQEGLRKGWDTVVDWAGFGSTPNRFKCKPPSGSRKHWMCYAPAKGGRPEEVISCPRGFLPERTAILHPSPKSRITDNYGLSIGGRMCVQVGLPNQAGMGPCNAHEFNSAGKKIVHRGNERTRILHPSPKKRLVKQSRGGRFCLKVVKPTPGFVPDFPHMKSPSRLEFEAAQRARTPRTPRARTTATRQQSSAPTVMTYHAYSAKAPSDNTWLWGVGAALAVTGIILVARRNRNVRR